MGVGRTLANYNIQKESTILLIIYSAPEPKTEPIKIKLSPNPASLFIQILGLTKTENYIIYNAKGELLVKGIISKDQKIAIQNFTTGIYLFKLDKRKAIKFIKK